MGAFGNENSVVGSTSVNVHDLLYDGLWHHVKVVLDRDDSNRIKIYLDGHDVRDLDKMFDGGAIYGSDGQFGFAIGHLTPWYLREGRENGFKGWIDEVRISKVARIKQVFAPTAIPLTAPIAGQGETQIRRFGHALAMAGHTMVIGAPIGNAGQSGSAYVGEMPGDFSALKRLEPESLPLAEHFGHAVAVDRQRKFIAVGAPGGSLPGNVYVFQYDATLGTCQSEAILDAAAGDQRFGWSVAMDDDTLAVGDPHHKTGMMTIGAVYMYKRDASNGSWNHVQTIDTATPDMALMPGADFGHTVALQGDRLLIGAPGDDNGEGASYLFTNNGNSENPWALTKKFTASDATMGNLFGHTVALDGDCIVVGTNVNPFSAGRAYIYEPNPQEPDAWLETRLERNDPGDQFGYAVAVDGMTVAVGAPGQDVNDDDAVYT